MAIIKKRRIEEEKTIREEKILYEVVDLSFTWAAKSVLRGHVAFLRGHARSVHGRADVRVVLLHALPYELRGALHVCFHHDDFVAYDFVFLCKNEVFVGFLGDDWIKSKKEDHEERERKKKRERDKGKNQRQKKTTKNYPNNNTFVVVVVVVVVEENNNARVFFFSFIREEELTCITECIDTWFWEKKLFWTNEKQRELHTQR